MISKLVLGIDPIVWSSLVAQDGVTIQVPTRLMRPEDLIESPWYALGPIAWVLLGITTLVALGASVVVWRRRTLDIHEQAFRAMCKKMHANSARVARYRSNAKDLGLRSPVGMLVSPRSVRLLSEEDHGQTHTGDHGSVFRAKTVRSKPVQGQGPIRNEQAGRVVFEGGVSRVVRDDPEHDAPSNKRAG